MEEKKKEAINMVPSSVSYRAYYTQSNPDFVPMYVLSIFSLCIVSAPHTTAILQQWSQRMLGVVVHDSWRATGLKRVSTYILEKSDYYGSKRERQS